MTDFDKFIKEKVDKKTYSYSASAWKGFAKKAGLKSALTTAQSLFIGIASVVVAASLGWVAYELLSPSEAPQSVDTATVAPQEPLQVVELVTDSTQVESEEVAKESVREPEKVRKSAADIVEETPAQKAEVDSVPENKPVRKPIARPKKPTRILVINPDTIPSND